MIKSLLFIEIKMVIIVQQSGNMYNPDLLWNQKVCLNDIRGDNNGLYQNRQSDR